jgi:hypothetical protein
MPVFLAGGRIEAIAWLKLDHWRAPALGDPTPFHDVQVLAVVMSMPVGASAWLESN